MRRKPNQLTQREREVLRHVANGQTDKEVAETLGISKRTVGAHVASVMKRTNSASRTQAVAKLLR